MVDAVIIGGGPAGVSAGTVLQRKGYKTCIIDTRFFPREKLCAGVLTVKSIKLIPLNPFIRLTPIQLIRPMQELNAQSIVSLPFQ